MRFERCFALWLLLFSALQFAACAEPTSDGDVERPNLILIVSDDQGYTDFGFMGSPYVQTPHLDRLAREGTVFPNGFVTASYCAPSLRSLLTGLHPLQLHFWLGQRAAQRGPDDLFEPMRDVATLPRVLGAREQV